MNIIDKVESKRKYCRHCYGNINHFEGLWGIFFEEFYKNYQEICWHIIDHISSNKYWFMVQPYGAFDEDGKICNEFKKLIDYSIKCGGDCVVIKDGYHYKGSSCFIFYPANASKFKKTINAGLDRHSRYDSYINIGAPHYMRFDKAYTRRLIRNYQPSEKSEIIRSAVNFLTWNEVEK